MKSIVIFMWVFLYVYAYVCHHYKVFVRHL